MNAFELIAEMKKKHKQKFCLQDPMRHHSGSPCHISHYVEPPSPKVAIKRGFLGTYLFTAVH